MNLSKQNSIWKAFLLNNTFDESFVDSHLVFIHFKSNNQNMDDFPLEIIASLFDTISVLMIDNTSGVIILNQFPEFIDESLYEIQDLLMTDFNISLKFLIGNLHPLNKNTYETFHKERSYLEHLSETVEFIADIYIQKDLPKNLDLSRLYPLASKLIENDKDLNQLIQKLWETSNNTSQAASELYIHRNTLLYRINKFQKDTSLDLKNPNELLIAYLLTQR